MWAFDYRNVQYKIDSTGTNLLIKGEIANRSGQSFSSIVFRVVIFAKATPLGNTTFILNGFYAHQTRDFEACIKDITDRKIIATITRCDINPESAY